MRSYLFLTLDPSSIEVFRNFSVKTDTIFTVTTSITVFLCGFLINGIIKGIAKWRDRNLKRVIVNFSMPTITDALEKEINGLIKFSGFLNVDSNEAKIISHISIPQLNSVASIGYQDLYKCYFSGFENILFRSDDIRVKAFSGFWSTVYHLETIHEEVVSDATDIVSEIQKLNAKRNASAQKAMDLIEKFRIEKHNEVFPQDFAAFYGFINSAVVAWQQDQNRIQPTSVNSFLSAVVIAIQENTPVCLKYKEHFDTVTISSIANEAINDYLNQLHYVEASYSTIINKVSNYREYRKKLLYFTKHLG